MGPLAAPRGTPRALRALIRSGEAVLFVDGSESGSLSQCPRRRSVRRRERGDHQRLLVQGVRRFGDVADSLWPVTTSARLRRRYVQLPRCCLAPFAGKTDARGASPPCFRRAGRMSRGHDAWRSRRALRVLKTTTGRDALSRFNAARRIRPRALRRRLVKRWSSLRRAFRRAWRCACRGYAEYSVDGDGSSILPCGATRTLGETLAERILRPPLRARKDLLPPLLDESFATGDRTTEFLQTPPRVFEAEAPSETQGDASSYMWRWRSPSRERPQAPDKRDRIAPTSAG